MNLRLTTTMMEWKCLSGCFISKRESFGLSGRETERVTAFVYVQVSIAMAFGTRRVLSEFGSFKSLFCY